MAAFGAADHALPRARGGPVALTVASVARPARRRAGCGHHRAVEVACFRRGGRCSRDDHARPPSCAPAARRPLRRSAHRHPITIAAGLPRRAGPSGQAGDRARVSARLLPRDLPLVGSQLCAFWVRSIRPPQSRSTAFGSSHTPSATIASTNNASESQRRSFGSSGQFSNARNPRFRSPSTSDRGSILSSRREVGNGCLQMRQHALGPLPRHRRQVVQRKHRLCRRPGEARGGDARRDRGARAVRERGR